MRSLGDELWSDAEFRAGVVGCAITVPWLAVYLWREPAFWVIISLAAAIVVSAFVFSKI